MIMMKINKTMDMYRSKFSKLVALLAVTWIPLMAMAQVQEQNLSTMPADSIVPEHIYSVQCLSRTYGDRIVLRWAPDEYVSWRYLNANGYMVKRMMVRPGQDPLIDTLATVRPWPRSRFLSTFEENDTLAAAAVQVLYGRTTTLDNTEAAGTGGSIMEVYDEQQNVYGYAMMVAELRPDLAEAMGLSYVDHDVKPNATYYYSVFPLVPDSLLKVQPAVGDAVTNVPYEPDSCHVAIADSILPPSRVLIYWSYETWSAYDIERRRIDDGQMHVRTNMPAEEGWQVLNDRPYISMMPQEGGDQQYGRYLDENVEPGVWQYRLRGYDSFGDKSLPSEVHTIVLPDFLPPATPHLLHIDIDRPENKIFATLHWSVDEIDEDLLGYIPFYSRDGKEAPWVPLSEELTEPTDTFCTVDVTDYSTGLVTVAAIDTAGNVVNSMPLTIDIADLIPPLPPTNVRGACSPEGAAVLTWTPSPSGDVKYYDVYTANDSSHVFMLQPGRQMVADTFALDTLSTHVNQRYKYYKVVAVDYSGNNSIPSEIFRMRRPYFIPPEPCYADSTWQDEHIVGMRWKRSADDQEIVTYRLFRRQGENLRWKKVHEWSTDTMPNTKYIDYIDDPEPNQTERYYYAMECVNDMGISSGLSMQTSFLHVGVQIFDIPIKLYANFDSEKRQVNLSWDVNGEIPIDVPYRFVLYRRSVDAYFRAYLTAESDEAMLVDRRLLANETAEYYVHILFEDGRRSTDSNIMKVRNTLKENTGVTELESALDSDDKNAKDEDTSAKGKKTKKSKKSKK